MLFWLKKAVGTWIMPLPFALGLIVIGSLLLGLRRTRRLGRGALMFGVVWIVVFSNSGVGTWLVRGLEKHYAPAPLFDASTPLPVELKECVAVAVLGGGHRFTPDRAANLLLSESALARIVEGVRVVRQLPDAALIVSGPANPGHGPSHARVLADVAVSLGIPRARIVEIDTARDTEDEIAALKDLAGEQRIALITSAWHMPRAAGLARAKALTITPCPADYAARDTTLRPTDFMRWDVGGLERSTKAFYEAAGLVWMTLKRMP
jgi:uncharacterized SAM-binding protein YcdF (DUF218 family)